MKKPQTAVLSSNFQTERGFTLLEVMVAVSILAIGLTALFGSQSKSLSLATEAHFNNIAPMLALLKLAEIQSGIIPLENTEGEFEENFSDYSFTIEISDAQLEKFEAVGNIDPPLQQVTLTVAWNETNLTYSLTYYDRQP